MDVALTAYKDKRGVIIDVKSQNNDFGKFQ